MKCACGAPTRVVMTRHHGGAVYRKRKCTEADCAYGDRVTEEKIARGNTWPANLRDEMLGRLMKHKEQR